MGAEKQTTEHTSHIDALPDGAIKATIADMQHGLGINRDTLMLCGISTRHEANGSISFNLQTLLDDQSAIVLRTLNDQIADGARVIVETKK